MPFNGSDHKFEEIQSDLERLKTNPHPGNLRDLDQKLRRLHSSGIQGYWILLIIIAFLVVVGAGGLWLGLKLYKRKSNREINMPSKRETEMRRTDKTDTDIRQELSFLGSRVDGE